MEPGHAERITSTFFCSRTPCPVNIIFQPAASSLRASNDQFSTGHSLKVALDAGCRTM
jgi:hypothetical protein